MNINKRMLAFAGFLMLCIFIVFAGNAAKVKAEQQSEAASLELNVSSSAGEDTSGLADADYRSTVAFSEGTVLTLTTAEPAAGLYIKWYYEPRQYEISVNGTTHTYGKNGYLHEYIELPEKAAEVLITIPEGGACLSDIYALSEGELPSWVQVWEEPYEEADILIISAHSDDDVLFFGGVIPTYINRGGVRIQVAYFCDFSVSEPYRMQESLDSLWIMGITHYPKLGEFEDLYSEDIETARSQYDTDAALGYIVRLIRQFKPQVLVTHDINGEYGHGCHMLVSELTRQAVEISADSASYTDSAQSYGTWDVPKTYLHLYQTQDGAQIELDARVPLDAFGTRTCLEILKEAYLAQESQQWMWFYVDDGYDDEGNPDGYAYSCTKFGLYRTTVGADTENDILCNINTYDVRDAQEESSRQAALESEREREEASGEDFENGDSDSSGSGAGNVFLTVLIVLASLLGAAVLGLLITAFVISRIKKRRRAQRARRRAPARQKGR